MLKIKSHQNGFQPKSIVIPLQQGKIQNQRNGSQVSTNHQVIKKIADGGNC